MPLVLVQMGQNCVKPVPGDPRCGKTRPLFVRLAIELGQGLALPLQFHLRVFFKHLRIALPQHLRQLLIGDSPALSRVA
jgi:hypothetical protein